MSKIVKLKGEGLVTYATFVAMAVYYAIVMMQGIDVCDDGFLFSSYQQIFSSPKTIEYNHLFWLTTVTGGIWYNIFPEGGIISFRILAAITFIFTMLLTRNTLKAYVPNKYILISLLMIMIGKGTGMVDFSYNTLGGLLAVVVMMFLLKGTIKKDKFYLFGSGFFIGLGIFGSIPFITMCIVLLAIPFYLYINNSFSYQTAIKQILYIVAGIFSSVVVVICIMKLLGHLSVFSDAVQSLFMHSKTADSNHQLTRLFKSYTLDYIEVAKFGSLLAFGTFCMVLIKKQINVKLFTLVWYASCFIFFSYVINEHNIYSTYFLCIAGALFIVFDNSQSKELRLIAMVALLVALFLPIGTDPGIKSIGHDSIWLCLPMFYVAASNLELKVNLMSNSNKAVAVYFNKDSLRPVLKLFTVAFFVVKFISICNSAYFDPGSRFDKTFLVNSDLAKHIYTTKERAGIINTAIDQLKNVVKPGDYLLVYDKMPMLHYLTNTKPYCYNPWVWSYDSHNFEQKIKKAEKEIKELPPVLVHKFETIFEFSEPYENYLDENSKENYFNRVKSHKVLNSFLKRNRYKITWENKYYSLYQTDIER